MQIVDEDFEETRITQEWLLRGGSALPLMQLHMERGDHDKAAAVARLALSLESCPDAEEIERLLDRCSNPPENWASVLDEFATAPSVERWRELMLFVPEDHLYQRMRNGIRDLRKRGVDGNVLFLCACVFGMTPDAIELVEEGKVTAETIVSRSAEAGGAVATYLGLAGIAAYVAGDFLGAVRFLREATAAENDLCPAFPHIFFVRERATAEELEALDRAGLAEEW